MDFAGRIGGGVTELMPQVWALIMKTQATTTQP